jgi:hypothetical protein
MELNVYVKRKRKMKNDHGYFVIEDVSDFQRYEIIFHEEHKPGVFKLWLKRNLKEYAKFIQVYCKKEFMPIDIDAHNKYWMSQ